MENLKTLYDNIKGDYDLPDFDTFTKDMSDPAKLERLHNTLTADNWDVPDFNQFQIDMSPEKKKAGEVLPPASGSQSGTDSPATPQTEEPDLPSSLSDQHSKFYNWTQLKGGEAIKARQETALAAMQGDIEAVRKQREANPQRYQGMSEAEKQRTFQMEDEFAASRAKQVAEQPLTTQLLDFYKAKFGEGSKGDTEQRAVSMAMDRLVGTPEGAEMELRLKAIYDKVDKNDPKAVQNAMLDAKEEMLKVTGYGDNDIWRDFAESNANFADSDPQAYQRRMRDQIAAKYRDAGMSEEEGYRDIMQKTLDQGVMDEDRTQEGRLVMRVDDLKRQLAKEEGYASPQRLKVIQAEIEKTSSDIAAMRERRLEAVDEERRKVKDMMVMDNPPVPQEELKAALSRLDKVKEGFINPDAQFAAKYDKYNEEAKAAAPAGTPMEQLRKLYAEKRWDYLQTGKRILQAEGKGGDLGFAINELGNSLAGFISGGHNDDHRRLVRLKAEIEDLAPIVFLNESPAMRDAKAGFGASAWNGLLTTMGGQGSPLSGTTRQEDAILLSRNLQIAGITPEMTSDPENRTLKERMRDPGLKDSEFWGNLMGTSGGLMFHILAASQLTKGLGLGGAIQKLVSAGNKALGAGKYGGAVLALMGDAVESGINYKTAGTFSVDNADELSFMGGFFGGAAASLGKAGFDGATKAVAGLFGNKAGEAAKLISEWGASRIGAGVGESFEETGQQIVQMWNQSTTGQTFWEKMGKQFGDLSEAVKFYVSTMVMGMGMGGAHSDGLGAYLRDYAEQQLEGMSPGDRQEAEAIGDQMEEEAAALVEGAREGGEETVEETPAEPFDMSTGQPTINVTQPQEVQETPEVVAAREEIARREQVDQTMRQQGLGDRVNTAQTHEERIREDLAVLEQQDSEGKLDENGKKRLENMRRVVAGLDQMAGKEAVKGKTQQEPVAQPAKETQVVEQKPTVVEKVNVGGEEIDIDIEGIDLDFEEGPVVPETPAAPQVEPVQESKPKEQRTAPSQGPAAQPEITITSTPAEPRQKPPKQDAFTPGEDVEFLQGPKGRQTKRSGKVLKARNDGKYEVETTIGGEKTTAIVSPESIQRPGSSLFQESSSEKEDFDRPLSHLLSRPNAGAFKRIIGDEAIESTHNDVFSVKTRGSRKETLSIDIVVTKSAGGRRFIAMHDGYPVAGAFVNNAGEFVGIITDIGSRNIGIGKGLAEFVMGKNPQAKVSGPVSKQGGRLGNKMGLFQSSDPMREKAAALGERVKAALEPRGKLTRENFDSVMNQVAKRELPKDVLDHAWNSVQPAPKQEAPKAKEPEKPKKERKKERKSPLKRERDRIEAGLRDKFGMSKAAAKRVARVFQAVSRGLQKMGIVASPEEYLRGLEIGSGIESSESLKQDANTEWAEAYRQRYESASGDVEYSEHGMTDKGTSYAKAKPSGKMQVMRDMIAERLREMGYSPIIHTAQSGTIYIGTEESSGRIRISDHRPGPYAEKSVAYVDSFEGAAKAPDTLESFIKDRQSQFDAAKEFDVAAQAKRESLAAEGRAIGRIERTYSDLEKVSSVAGREGVVQTSLGVDKSGKEAFSYEFTEPINQYNKVNLPSRKYLDLSKSEEVLRQNANAQYRVEQGKRIAEVLRRLSSNEAESAALHEVVGHDSLFNIIDAAANGNQAAIDTLDTILSEYNKAAGASITTQQVIDGNNALAQGRALPDGYRDMQEWFARSLERYLHEGPKGFSKKMQKVFDAIKATFRSLYGAVVSGAMDVPLTDNMRDVFSRILGAHVAEYVERETPKEKAEMRERGLWKTLDRYRETNPAKFNEVIDRARAAASTYYKRMGMKEEFEAAKKELEANNYMNEYEALASPMNSLPVDQIPRRRAKQLLSARFFGDLAEQLADEASNADTDEAREQALSHLALAMERSQALLATASLEGTLYGQANAMNAQWTGVMENAASYITDAINRHNKELLNGKPGNKRSQDEAKERRRKTKEAKDGLNADRPAIVDGVENSERVDAASEAVVNENAKPREKPKNSRRKREPGSKTGLGKTKEQIAEMKRQALLDMQKAAREGFAGSTGSPALFNFMDAAGRYGYALVAEGVITFKEWSAKMRADIPQLTEDQAKEVWDSQVVDGDTIANHAKGEVEKAVAPRPKRTEAQKKTLRGKVRDAIRNHFKKGADPNVTLQDRLMDEAGLTEEEAQFVYEAVRAEVEARAKAKIEARAKALRRRPPKQRKGDGKSDIQKAVDAMVDGEFTDEQVRQIFADRLGYGTELTAEQVAELRRLGAVLRSTEPGSRAEQVAAMQMDRYASQFVPTGTRLEEAWGIWKGLVYASVLSGVPTHMKNILSSTSMIALTLADAFTNISKWSRSIRMAMKAKDGEKLRMLARANPVTEMLVKMEAMFKALPKAHDVFMDIMRHGVLDSKYMEKNKARLGRLQNPLERISFKGGKWNPYNYMKYVGRLLAAEDAFMFTIAHEAELADAVRRARLESADGSVREVSRKALAENSQEWQSAMDQAGNDIDAVAQALKLDGKAKERAIRIRAREILHSRLGLDDQAMQDAEDIARSKIFTLKRNGMNGKIATAMKMINNSKLGAVTWPFIMFTDIIGNVGDTMGDFNPIRGIARANGITPSAALAALSGGKSARMSTDRKSELYYEQMGRAWFGKVLFTAVMAMMFSGDDDDRWLDFTGDSHPTHPNFIKINGRPIMSWTLLPWAVPSLSFATKLDESFKKNPNMSKDDMVGWGKRLGLAWFASETGVSRMSMAESANALLEFGSVLTKSVIDKKLDIDKTIRLIGEFGKSVMGVVTKPFPQRISFVEQAAQLLDPSVYSKKDIDEIFLYAFSGAFFRSATMDVTKQIDIFGKEIKRNIGSDLIDYISNYQNDAKTRKRVDFLYDHGVEFGPTQNRAMLFEEDGEVVKEKMSDVQFEKYAKLSGEKFAAALDEYMADRATWEEAYKTPDDNDPGKTMLEKNVKALMTAARYDAKMEMDEIPVSKGGFGGKRVKWGIGF